MLVLLYMEVFIKMTNDFQSFLEGFNVHEIDKSLVLDEILYDGDTLYKRTINNLKAQAKFVHS